jgi:hypothetical protein
MARAAKPVDIGDSPDLLRLVEEMRADNAPCVLRRDHEDVAIVRPVKRSARSRGPRGRPTGADDPLWRLVGVGASAGPGDVSANKHACLAAAYADRHE